MTFENTELKILEEGHLKQHEVVPDGMCEESDDSKRDETKTKVYKGPRVWRFGSSGCHARDKV